MLSTLEECGTPVTRPVWGRAGGVGDGQVGEEAGLLAVAS